MDNMFQLLIQHLDKFLPHLNTPQLAVAVSGGSDSMALCLLLNEWAKTYNFKVTALTVDHQLRLESTIEADKVHQWLSARGIHHEILVWHHDLIHCNIQEQAREARYKLLIEYCKQHHIQDLFLGHHLHDQWETFFMRLAHGSGLKGLSAMQPMVTRQGIHIFRPFLTVNPYELENYLIRQNQPWIEDPSNQSDAYERIRWRNQLTTLSHLGLTPQIVAKTCEKLHHEDEALDWSAARWIQENTSLNTHLKFVKSDLSLKHLPKSLMKRVALHITSQVRGIDITSKDTRHNMEALYNKLCSDPLKAFTFGGCYWMEFQGTLYVMREWNKCPTEIISTPQHMYDHRFILTDLPLRETLVPIGKQHWPEIKPYVQHYHLPYQAFLSLPTLIQNGTPQWLISN